ncbi:MAG: alpha/beta hydrolase [Veillonellales bacterium]
MKSLSISANGKQLAAVLHEPVGGSSDTVLIICHGFRGSKEGGGRAFKLANRAAKLGVYVLRFDFTPQEMLSCQLKELTAVVGYCRNFIAPCIILLGRSMGGSAALAFSAADRQIAGLCLWSTPWDLQETFRLSLGQDYEMLRTGNSIIKEDEWGFLQLLPGFVKDFKNFDLLRLAKSLPPIPVLIIHGSQDAIVPVCKAKMLWEKILSPKQLTVIDGGDHQFLHHSEQAADTVINWLSSQVL